MHQFLTWGATIAGLVRATTKEKALTMLDRESRFTLAQRDLAAFSKALGGAFKTNTALKGALAETKKSVRRA